MTKTCRRIVPVEDGHERAEVELERFAAFDDEGLTLDPVTVQVIAQVPLSLSFAAHLADTIVRMVEIGQQASAAA